MGQEVVIRPCGRRDWRSIRLLFHRHFPAELPFSRLDRELWALYRDIVVAELDGSVIGAAWVRHGLVENLCWLDFIAVEAEHRRHGVAGRLLAAVERLALAAGEKEMGLAVLRENSPALELYEKIGFTTASSNEREHRLRRVIPVPTHYPSVTGQAPERSFLALCVDKVLYLVVTLGA